MQPKVTSLRAISADLASYELSTTARIFDIVRSSEQTSRADIARIAGMSRATVTHHIDRLLHHGLVLEGGNAESTGGRRARIVTFNKDAGYVAGVEFGVTSLDVAITNLAGEILSHAGSAADIRDGPEPLLAQAQDMLKEQLKSLSIPVKDLMAIGIGLPGPVEFKTGQPISPPIMPGWDQYPVREVFADDFACPVYVDNDVNVMALGEQWRGLGRGVDNFLFVKVGTGIGCGIVCQGHLYRGADGCAGDIGHIEVDKQPVVCRCGNVGCLEALAAAPALVRLAEQAVMDGRSTMLQEHLAQYGRLTVHDVIDYSRRGDYASVEIIKRSGQLIGHVLAGLVNFFNPSLIVMGGGISTAGDVWLASIRQEIYRRSLPLGSKNLSIQRSQVGEHVGVIGAALLAVEQIFCEVGLSQSRDGVVHTIKIS